MTDREIAISAVKFFRKMAANYEADRTNDGSYTDGMSSGSAISLNVAAEHLESLFGLEDK